MLRDLVASALDGGRIITDMNQRHRMTLGTVPLLLSAVIWGFAFVAQRAGMQYVGPFTFNGLRFALGALVLLPWLVFSRSGSRSCASAVPRRDVLAGLALAGVVLFASANLQQLGLVETTAGKAGFITGLYVVIVPVLGLLRGHAIRGWVWAGCAVSVVGLYLLSVVGILSLSPGDAWVLAGAFGWAVHVHVVEWLVRRARPVVIAVTQFAICAVLSLIVAVLTESIRIQAIVSAGWTIAYAGALSVGVAYTLQVIGQRHVEPAPAGIILSLESVFAVLGGWWILGETLSLRGAVGCALMLAGIMMAQRRAGPSAGAPQSRTSS